MIIAAGPFTTSDSVHYQPLYDLLEHVKRMKPDVLVLLGPFVNAEQPNIEDIGKIELQDGKGYTFQSLLEEKVVGFCLLPMFFRNLYYSFQLKPIIDCVSTQSTTCLIVPSVQEASELQIYPCPPLSLSSTFKTEHSNKLERIIFLPEPANLSINGINFAFSSTDSLFPILQSQAIIGSNLKPSQTKPHDRISTIIEHIFTQRSFLPLNPAPPNLNVVDEKRLKFANLPQPPHVFVMPSKLSAFIKEVSQTLCINPRNLTQQMVGGTFVKLFVRVPEGEKAADVLDCYSAEVVKV